MTTDPALLHVPTKDVRPDPENPRRTLDEDERARLVDSVRQHGIITPLVLRPNGKGYVVVAGHNRLAAAQAVGLKTVPAIVRADGGSSRVVSIVENVARQDLNPIDEGDAYLALGLPAEQVAALVNRPLERIVDRLQLAALPEPARAAVVAGAPLAALRELAAVAALDAPLGAALAFGAEHGLYPWAELEDPARCLDRLQRADLGRKKIQCKACKGHGTVQLDGQPFDSDEAAEEADAWQPCQACDEEGHVWVEDKKAPKPPPYFAVVVGDRAEVLPEMVAQLTDEARGRIAAAAERAAGHAETIPPDQRHFYGNKPPELALAGDEARHAAESIEGAAIRLSRGHFSTLVVTAPDVVSEYLPGAYEQSVETWIKPPKQARSSTASPKPPKADMTPAEQKKADAEDAKRAAERQAELERRLQGRAFNADLGVALAGIGEVPVTAAVVKLLVGDVIRHTRATQWNGREGKGHALWHRYVGLDWPLRKNGDPIWPRSAADRADYAKEVDERVDRELARAKTAEQALAVLARYLGAGLADLSGLPNVDLEGAFPYRGDGYRAWVTKLLPRGLQRRVPEANGLPSGSSYEWKP